MTAFSTVVLKKLRFTAPGFKTVIASLIVSVSFSVNADDSVKIDLEEYIDGLRAQFESIMDSSDDKKLKLYISPIDVELKTTTEKTAKGGLKTYIVSAEAGLKDVSAQTLKFKVSVNKDLSMITGENNSGIDTSTAIGDATGWYVPKFVAPSHQESAMSGFQQIMK